MSRTIKITLDNFSAKRIDGFITNQPIELSEQYVEALAESILQVMYNTGVFSGVEINYDLKIDGSTKYYVHGTDVTVVPQNQEPYTRRIRNNANIIKKDKKDDDIMKDLENNNR